MAYTFWKRRCIGNYFYGNTYCCMDFQKVEKKKAFLICQGISIFGYILFWFLFVPGKPYMFLFALPFFSFGIGSLFTLMMSMTADVCDMDELNSGKRREGILVLFTGGW